jgi:hypothetical protein
MRSGTHTPRSRVFGTEADAFLNDHRQGFWVPAFAGTIRGGLQRFRSGPLTVPLATSSSISGCE